MKKLMLAVLILNATGAMANLEEPITITIEEISIDSGLKMVGTNTNGSRGGLLDDEDDRRSRNNLPWDEDNRKPRNNRLWDEDGRNSRHNNNRRGSSPFGPDSSGQDPTERAGRVISVARDLVALGEVVYDLVQKGKPTNQTEYAPISVVPKDSSGEPVDPFELEGFSLPTERKFRANVRQGVKQVVQFEYMVIFSHGGTYNGRGRYITGAQIIPVSIKTSFGWTFSATMRASGIMNHGSVANPVAGVMLTMQFKANGWARAFEQNETVHLTGNGQVQAYNR
jgi:hypothetical protein